MRISKNSRIVFLLLLAAVLTVVLGIAFWRRIQTAVFLLCLGSVLFGAGIALICIRVWPEKSMHDRNKYRYHALPWQINQLFLFNTLHNVAALTLVDSEKARHVIEMLAEYIRAVQEMNREEFSLLAQEFKCAETLLDIEKSRLGDRLEIVKEIQQSCSEVRVPSLILQPLVESAVRHGVELNYKMTQVILSGKCDESKVVIEISDTGRGFEDEIGRESALSEMGFDQIKEQLKHFYGDLASMKVTALAPSGTRVKLVIPRTHKKAV